MRIGSREYQARLRPTEFAPAEGDVERFLKCAADLHPLVRLHDQERRDVWFTRELWDTPHRAFHLQGLKLRTRSHDGFVACTYKAVGLDRYAIESAPVHSTDPAAKSKFEEGIYAFHASFSRQTTTKQPLPFRLVAVGDWARLFPGALEVASWHEPLYCTSRSRVQRVRGLALEFAGTRVDAMLEIHYAPSVDVPEKVEFSWKHRDKRERYAPEVARLMRTYLQAVNHSTWADPSAHLKKALADGASRSRMILPTLEMPSSRLVEETPSQILKRILGPRIAEPAE